MLNALAGGVIESGPKAGKRLEFLELGVGKFEVARHRSIDGPLRLAADAGNGFANIDRRQYAQFKQRGRKLYLSVSDGNQVGRNVGGYVLGLSLNDG